MTSRTRFNAFPIATVFFVALALPPFSLAFDEDAAGRSIHMDITEEALKDRVQLALSAPYGGAGSVWRFQPAARNAISIANKGVDWLHILRPGTIAGLVPGTAHQHFDDNELAEGAEHLLKQRQKVLEDLRLAEKKARGEFAFFSFSIYIDSARKELGKALHTLQDFYAHSNWVERNPGSQMEPGLVWSSGDTTIPFASGGQMDCSCGSSRGGSSPLATGIFRYPLSRMTLEVRENATACIHGPAEPHPVTGQVVTVPGCPSTLVGMNKDKAAAGELHTRAKDAATAATAAYTLAILEEARQKGYLVAVCAFMGYGNLGPCSAQEEHLADPLPILPWSMFSTGDYKTEETATFNLPKFDGTKGVLRAITTSWEFIVDAEATCPANPSSVIGGANACLAIRRFANFAISSEKLGNNTPYLYCNTNPDLVSSSCGFGNTFLPDNNGFTYISWSGGSHRIQYVFHVQKRYLNPPASVFVATHPGETFDVTATYISRLLFYLGILRGSGLEPLTYSGTGGYFSLQGNITLRPSITYEYVPNPEVGTGTPMRKGSR